MASGRISWPLHSTGGNFFVIVHRLAGKREQQGATREVPPGMVEYSESVTDAGYEDALAGAQDKVANLEQALQNARLIGAAVGIVMANRKITYEQAFQVLRDMSQRSHRKIRDLSEEVVFTGVLDEAYFAEPQAVTD